MPEFKPWPKIERLTNLDMIITEKIDGTNACVAFIDDGSGEPGNCLFHAQSRNRIIEPGNDNAGFAAWAHDHWEELFAALGYGYHYGEWWGRKIGRNYDREDRTFSLFNVGRWNQPYQAGQFDHIEGLDVVPLLLHSTLDLNRIQETYDKLQAQGSVAAPGFARPEGICVYLPRLKTYAKVTDAMGPKGPKASEHDELPTLLVQQLQAGGR